MAGAHKGVWIFYGVFVVASLKIWQKRISIKKAAKLFIIIYFMLFGKELWKNGVFASKTKRRILEDMLTSCPGLEQLKFSV